MIQPQVREAQPLIIQADVMREEMTSCCEVEYTGKSIPLLLHQVISRLCRLLSVHKGCYIAIYITLQGRKEVLTSVLDSLLLHSWLQSGTKICNKNPILYIRGTSETIACVLQAYNICIAHKLRTTLWQLLTNVKDKDKLEDRQGAVYKIKNIPVTVSLDFLFTCQILSKDSQYM